MTLVFGVIGFPLKHSLSPVMHNSAFRYLKLDAIYLPFEIRPEELEDELNRLENMGVKGINVTIPHKERVVEIFNPSREAEEIGAGNTVLFDGRRVFNTDIYGIRKALENAGINPEDLDILVVGAGGAGKSAVYALMGRNRVFITNRTEEKGREVAEKFGVEFLKISELEGRKFDLIVNATPLGMKGFENRLPIPISVVKNSNAVFDMVYNPPETPLVLAGRKYGCKIASGVDMLVYQGAKAFEIFTGLNAPVDVMKKAVLSELKKV